MNGKRHKMRARGKGEVKHSRGLSVDMLAVEELWQAQLSWAVITFGRLTRGGTQNSGERSKTQCGGICHFLWVMCHWLSHSWMRCIGLWAGKAVCFYEYARKHQSNAACSRSSRTEALPVHIYNNYDHMLILLSPLNKNSNAILCR